MGIPKAIKHLNYYRTKKMYNVPTCNTRGAFTNNDPYACHIRLVTHKYASLLTFNLC